MTEIKPTSYDLRATPKTKGSPVVIKILDDEIELHQTIKGDELKYWIDGSKGYLDANDCRDLAQTMIEAAIVLENALDHPTT